MCEYDRWRRIIPRRRRAVTEPILQEVASAAIAALGLRAIRRARTKEAPRCPQ
jgi:hypothetical protein